MQTRASRVTERRDLPLPTPTEPQSVCGAPQGYFQESQRAMVAARLESYSHGGHRRTVQDAKVHLARSDPDQRVRCSPIGFPTGRCAVVDNTLQALGVLPARCPQPSPVEKPATPSHTKLRTPPVMRP